MTDTIPQQTASPDPPQVSADTAMTGPQILPTERIKLYNASDWEQFVLEWAHSLRGKYTRVERCGGAGDKGRDVIAFPDEDDADVWDNYQCKHYDHPLMPSDVWVELGKLVYYVNKGEFAYPRRYFFVAPQGAGTTLSNLLRRPDQLRQGLLEKWPDKCLRGITSAEEVPLTDDLRNDINSLDFSICGYVPPLSLIEQHRVTPYHITRFGGGLPERPPTPTPPETPAPHEVVYIRKLLDAYAEHLGREVRSHNDVAASADLAGHYKDSRLEFYSAESLRTFSRDTLPKGSYEQLQDEVYDGLRDEIRANHRNGYERVLAVVRIARSLALTSHALVPRLHQRDRGGMCHQLANDRDEVTWVKS